MIRIAVITLFILIGLTPVSFASVALSVNPIDGSNTLRFGKTPVAGLDNKQEIHIRVNSTSGTRYQVFQRILEPIMNDKGEPLNLQALQTQTLANSNSSGTLYLQNSDRLTMSDQLLYSSSQSGESDFFVVGYNLDRNLVDASGTFRGRLVFTVRGSDGTSDQMILDVLLLLQAAPNLKISVRGAHNPMGVHIHNSDTTDKTADYVRISFSGNAGQEIRIYQQIETMPQDESEQELGPDVLQIDPQGESEGLRIHGPTSLGDARSLIYSSNNEQDDVNIYFLVNPNVDANQQQDAGTYSGKINYIVEVNGAKREFPINIQYDIQPEFTMNVTMPAGGVSYTHVLANSPPQDQEVLVTVLSNLHKPYQVLQNLQTNMVNEKGKEFDSKYLTLQVQIPAGQRGQTNFTEFSPVQMGEYPVFSSDAGGSGATFKVVYRLQGYAQMTAGDFSAPVRFSLNQK